MVNAIKKTPLHGWHVKDGVAKMGMFSGWEMPLRYVGELKEYNAVRNKAGLFDISHMGTVTVTGTDAESFVQYVTTNDVSHLNPGDVQYTLFCKNDGGILDDVTLYKTDYSKFFFIANASNSGKIYAWLILKSLGKFSVEISMPEDITILALQGPFAEKILSKSLPRISPPEKRYSFISVNMVTSGFVSRTGYTGEDGFEIIGPARAVEGLWMRLLGVGEEYGLLPCGLVARDMLRTEASMRLYGNDIDEAINPIEAGLEKYVSFEKGDFIGKTAIEKALALRNRRGGRFFAGFVMDVKLEHGDLIFDEAEVCIPRECGVVTSATYSPFLKKRIAMGYLMEKKNPGDIVWIKIGEEYRHATVTSMPFYSRKK